MTDRALRLLIRLAREAFRRGECRANPKVGDVVLEVTGWGTDVDSIGVLLAHGDAPLHVDGTGPVREVWDIIAFSGAHNAFTGTLRWENAEFVALPDDLAELALAASGSRR